MSGREKQHPIDRDICVASTAHTLFLSPIPFCFSEVWRGICERCGIVCIQRLEGAAYTLAAPGPPVDLLIDTHWSLPLSEIDTLPHRLVFYAWDPGKLGRNFHYAGNMLETVGPSERIVAQALRRPATSLFVQINKEMRSSGGFVFSWRKVLSHLGMTKLAIQKLVESHISHFAANWTSDLAEHMAALKAG